MSRAREAIRNVSWNYIQAAVSVVLFFLLTPLVVRHLGMATYGVWVLVHALLVYLNFFDLGIHTSLVRQVAGLVEKQHYRLINCYVAAAITMFFIAGVAAFVASLGLAYVIAPLYVDVPAEMLPSLQMAIVIYGIHFLYAFPGTALDALFEGHQRFDIDGMTGTFFSIVSAIATVVVLKSGYGVVALAATEALLGLVALLVDYFLLRRLYPRLKFYLGSCRGRAWRRLRSFSWWVALNEMLAEGSEEIDTLLIPFLMSIALVSPYAIICRVAGAIFLVIAPVAALFFPMAVTYEASNQTDKLRTLLIGGTKLLTGLALAIGVIVVLYGEPFIYRWINEDELVLPQGVLVVTVLNMLISAFILTSSIILMALNKLRILLVVSLAEAAIAVICILLLVPRYELLGMAASLLIANAVITFFWMVPLVCRAVSLRPARFIFEAALRPCIPSALMAAVLLLLQGQFESTSYWVMAMNSVAAAAVFLVAFLALALSRSERTEYLMLVKQNI